MTSTDVLNRDESRATEPVERTWACSGRAPQRPGQRSAPPTGRERLRKLAVIAGSAAAVVVAAPIVILVALAAAAPVVLAALLLFAWLLGLDAGTVGGGND
jgi:Flp pilus assembly protein TadB